MGRTIQGLTGGGEPAPRAEPWTDVGVPRDIYETAVAEAEKVGATSGTVLGYFQTSKREMGSRFDPAKSAAWSSVPKFSQWFQESGGSRPKTAPSRRTQTGLRSPSPQKFPWQQAGPATDDWDSGGYSPGGGGTPKFPWLQDKGLDPDIAQRSTRRGDRLAFAGDTLPTTESYGFQEFPWMADARRQRDPA